MFVEILDRRGRVRERVRLDAFPAQIGRGYDCDVIVDDPHVGALQCILECDASSGAIGLRAMPTRNPVSVHQGSQRVVLSPQTTRPLTLGETVIQMGKTTARIIVGTPAVATETPLTNSADPLAKGVVIAVVTAVGLRVLETWFGMVDEVKPSLLVSEAISLFAVLLAWSGAWAFVTRLLQGHTQFTAHLALAAASVVVGVVGTWLIDVLSFALNWPLLSRLRLFLYVALALAVVLRHMRIANGGVSNRVHGAASAVAFGLLAITLVNGYQSHKRVLPGGFMTHVLPPSWRLTGDATMESFFRKADSQKAAVDALQKIESDDEGFLE